MLKQAYKAIKSTYPDLTVLGGTTVKVPLPYLERLFQEGALDYMDAIAVHPYRGVPEVAGRDDLGDELARSEEHTSELQSIMRMSYAVFGLNNRKRITNAPSIQQENIVHDAS